MLFLALFAGAPPTQTLQSNQSDVARKNTASTIAAAMTAYTATNRGKLPLEPDVGSAVMSQWSEGDDEPRIKTQGEDDIDVYKVSLQKDCDGKASGSRAFSVSTKLNDGSRYCVDS